MNTTKCHHDEPHTVLEHLDALNKKIGNIEKTLGASSVTEEKITAAAKKNGIDVVLGGQWGDEGKGKLVDILSQVCKRKP